MRIMTEKQLHSIIESLLPSEELFIVDIKASFVKTPGKITIALDGDKGISIDQCAEISKSLGNYIEEQGLLEDPYNLEVSSPGLDQPFKFHRQYIKNIGKEVRVLLNNSNDIKGKLDQVNETGIQIREIKKTKNKSKKSYQDELTSLSFDDINKTNILLEF